MKIDKKKLKRQQQVIQRWKDNKAKGTLEAVTGFGKTFVALLIIKDMNKRRPERTTLIAVPTQHLKKQWTKKVQEMGLVNVEVETVHTIIKARRTVDLFILDEIHNYASDVFRDTFRVVKYKFVLGLTATLERMDNKQVIIESYCPVIDTVDMDEALSNNYVSDFRVFNLGIELDEADRETYTKIGNQFHKFFAWFGRDFDLAMRCLKDKEQRKRYARTMDCKEDQVMIFALNFMKYMRKRKEFLYYAPSKVEKAVELIERFPVPTITFSQTTDFCDRIKKRIPSLCVTYHNKMGAKEKRKAVEQFKNPRTKKRVINTARALDEGADMPEIRMAIICSGTSSPRQDLQRTGRAIRYSEGKLGMVVNLYIKDTQEEKWLRARQRKTKNVVYVDSVDEIERIINDLKEVV